MRDWYSFDLHQRIRKFIAHPSLVEAIYGGGNYFQGRAAQRAGLDVVLRGFRTCPTDRARHIGRTELRGEVSQKESLILSDVIRLLGRRQGFKQFVRSKV